MHRGAAAPAFTPAPAFTVAPRLCCLPLCSAVSFAQLTICAARSSRESDACRMAFALIRRSGRQGANFVRSTRGEAAEAGMVPHRLRQFRSLRLKGLSFSGAVTNAANRRLPPASFLPHLPPNCTLPVRFCALPGSHGGVEPKNGDSTESRAAFFNYFAWICRIIFCLLEKSGLML